jgi:hypothetical protein
MAAIDSLERSAVVLRGQRLEYFTIAWNTLEGLVAVVASAMVGSISLVGFGIDSFIEVTSGSVLLWRMSFDSDVHLRETNEKRALSLARCLHRLRLDFGFAVQARTRLSTAFQESFWRMSRW